MTRRTLEAVLFDLDGCLLDTAPDMVGAVNRLLEQEGRPPQPLESLKPYVSQGGLELVSRGFAMPREDPETVALWHRYMDIYADHVCEQTQLYDGLEQVLKKITDRKLRWGVVTNKPERFTLPLLEAAGLPSTPGAIVGGDTLAVSKPAPDPVIHACKTLEVSPDRAVMLGDDQRDIIAGKDAGTMTLAAGWGYIQPDDHPARWAADAVLGSTAELDAWLG